MFYKTKDVNNPSKYLEGYYQTLDAFVEVYEQEDMLFTERPSFVFKDLINNIFMNKDLKLLLENTPELSNLFESEDSFESDTELAFIIKAYLFHSLQIEDIPSQIKKLKEEKHHEAMVAFRRQLKQVRNTFKSLSNNARHLKNQEDELSPFSDCCEEIVADLNHEIRFLKALTEK